MINQAHVSSSEDQLDVVDAPGANGRQPCDLLYVHANAANITITASVPELWPSVLRYLSIRHR